MISILKKVFPEYLSSSEFYQSLEEDDEEIEIPKKFYKETKEIESFKDFKKLIKISTSPSQIKKNIFL
uniref:Uncharacterized protein n=1 Tax=viral metagenome TaxID=1070528 RepID=A0A6C0ADF1_9ZZZZ